MKLKPKIGTYSNDPTLIKLGQWNIWLAVLHAVQGLAIVMLAGTKVFPVSISYQAVDPLASEIAASSVLATATRTLFNVNLVYAVAAFFCMAAAVHAVTATVYRRRYEADLNKGINKVRWIGYGLSAGTMMIAIGLSSGITDLSLLFLLFVATLITALSGLAMELYNQGRKQVNWTAYGIGCIASLAAWVTIAIYATSANLYGGTIPAFVYWIYASMFVFFCGLMAVMYLHFKKQGKWADYVYVERAYMILGLVASSVSGWLIFAGALRP